MKTALILSFFAGLPGSAGTVQAVVAGQFSTNVNLVEVYASVTDRSGEPVTGLTASNFHIGEDGMPQTIVTFAAGDFPLSVVLALDRSFSMAGQRLQMAKSGATSFVTALRPDDEVSIVTIGSEIETLVPAMPARAAATAIRWDAIDAWGTTPLYDVIAAALGPEPAATRRRALVLISDGQDHESRTTVDEMIDRARRAGVLVYPIATGKVRPPAFAELASVTGGQSFLVDDPRRIAMTLATIARALRFQYLLGYVPARATGGAWRAIDVSVDRPDLRVRARDGYFVR